jgi:hypothetical protein
VSTQEWQLTAFTGKAYKLTTSLERSKNKKELFVTYKTVVTYEVYGHMPHMTPPQKRKKKKENNKGKSPII